MLDAVILLGLILLASFAFYVTPEFAANLPQDGIDFAMPAVNLLERGQLVVSLYGHNVPSTHPLGTSLLLVPAYVLFGHGLGNGIYAILLCAFSTIALVYLIGRRMGGRLCGTFAALFLITNYGFWQYSQKIMSEIPSVFLATVLLALLLAIPGRQRPWGACFTAGAALGFAIMVRYDNVILLVPSVLLLAWGSTGRKRVRNVATFLGGLVPFLVALAVYDQVTFGSLWRTGYHYHGLAGTSEQPLFSAGYVTKDGFMRLRQTTEDIPGIVDGNGGFYAKSLLSEADTTRIFGHPAYWQLPGRHLYQTLALLRTGLGVIGLLACLAAWQVDPIRRRFLLWFVGTAVCYIAFYLPYNWQEERFLIRLVPLFCLCNGIGVTALLARAKSRAVRAIVIGLTALVIGLFAFFNWQMGFPTGNDLHLYEVLTRVARQMEPNAVVVSNFDPLRLDAYVIRGTARIAVPLNEHRDFRDFDGNNGIPTHLWPFVASETPDKLRELILAGRPVYWLINNPWSGQASPELEALSQKSFRLQVLDTVSIDHGPDQPYFGRIELAGPKP